MHDVLRELRHADLVPFLEERFELLFVVSMLHRFWIVRGQELVVPALQLSLIGMVDPVQLGVQFLFGKVRRDAVQELPPVLEEVPELWCPRLHVRPDLLFLLGLDGLRVRGEIIVACDTPFSRRSCQLRSSVPLSISSSYTSKSVRSGETFSSRKVPEM